MSAQSVGLGSMFGWIPATFRLVSRNFGAMSVATILMILLGVLMVVPMMLVMFNSMSGLGSPGVPVAPANMGLFWATYGVTILVGLLVAPPLMAGWFRLCQAADRGERPSGLAVLEPYRDTATWGRLIVFALLAFLMYLVLMGLMFLMFRGVFTEIATMQAAQLAGGTPPPPSAAMLGKMMLMYVLFLPTMLLAQFVYMLGLAEVALRPTPPLQAFAEAFKATLRNALKLLLFGFCLMMGFGAVLAVVVLLFALLAAVLALLSPILMGIAIGLLYLVMILVIYPLMFAGNYLAWKDMLGGGDAALAPAPDAFAA